MMAREFEREKEEYQQYLDEMEECSRSFTSRMRNLEN